MGTATATVQAAAGPSESHWQDSDYWPDPDMLQDGAAGGLSQTSKYTAACRMP